ncbi:PEGA domain-containing protein [Candidatus Sumerlaeota bacterium]|nr:PEGA domain-containing protein [Candidatus Sumerlaeota bacterium]
MHPTQTPRDTAGLAKRITCLSLGAVVLIHTTSCGLIVSGNQTISLNSDPQGAEVKMDGMTQGQTPTSVRVSRRDEPIFTFEKEGYKTVQKSTEREPNTYFILDIIGGVLILVPFIGLLGAGDWDIEPGNISVVMDKKAPETRTATINVIPQTGTGTTTGTPMNVQIKLDSDTINAGDTLKVTVVMVPEGGSTATPPPTVDIYIHKDDKDLGQKEAKARRTSDGNYEAETEFKIPEIVKEGEYEVRVVVPPQAGAAATKTVTVNQ